MQHISFKVKILKRLKLKRLRIFTLNGICCIRSTQKLSRNRRGYFLRNVNLSLKN